MAGSYPDVPGYRFAYDVDGTTVVYHNLNAGTNATQSQATLQTTNGDLTNGGFATGGGGGAGPVVFLFPETRNLTGILINSNIAITSVQWSDNTTTGLDGDWTTISDVSRYNGTNKTLTRTNINAVNVTDITALRINVPAGSNSTRIFNVHLYGSIPEENSPDRLRIVDMNDDDIAAQFDFGNIPQRNAITKQFRVVNNSSDLTANNITVTLSTLNDASPTLIGQFQVSTDNVAYANAVNIGDLGPGESSGTMYVRDSVASNAQLSVWSARITAHPTSWS